MIYVTILVKDQHADSLNLYPQLQNGYITVKDLKELIKDELEKIGHNFVDLDYENQMHLFIEQSYEELSNADQKIYYNPSVITNLMISYGYNETELKYIVNDFIYAQEMVCWHQFDNEQDVAQRLCDVNAVLSSMPPYKRLIINSILDSAEDLDIEVNIDKISERCQIIEPVLFDDESYFERNSYAQYMFEQYNFTNEDIEKMLRLLPSVDIYQNLLQSKLNYLVGKIGELDLVPEFYGKTPNVFLDQQVMIQQTNEEDNNPLISNYKFAPSKCAAGCDEELNPESKDWMSLLVLKSKNTNIQQKVHRDFDKKVIPGKKLPENLDSDKTTIWHNSCLKRHQESNPDYQKKPCTDFLIRGACKKGIGCKYLHAMPDKDEYPQFYERYEGFHSTKIKRPQRRERMEAKRRQLLADEYGIEAEIFNVDISDVQKRQRIYEVKMLIDWYSDWQKIKDLRINSEKLPKDLEGIVIMNRKDIMTRALKIMGQANHKDFEPITLKRLLIILSTYYKFLWKDMRYVNTAQGEKLKLAIIGYLELQVTNNIMCVNLVPHKWLNGLLSEDGQLFNLSPKLREAIIARQSLLLSKLDMMFGQYDAAVQLAKKNAITDTDMACDNGASSSSSPSRWYALSKHSPK